MEYVGSSIKEPTESSLTTILLTEIKAELEDDHQVPNFMRWLMECLETNNGIQQVGLVKQIGVALQKSCTAPANQVTLCAKVLVQMYLKAESNQVIKRAIASTLQTFPHLYHTRVVEYLTSSLREEILASSQDHYSDVNKRHLVDSITSCVDQFNLGISCISEMVDVVLKFLYTTMDAFAARLQYQKCPTDVQKACLDCQATVRALILVLQKTEKAVPQLRSDCQLLQRLVDVTVQLLVAEENSLDCRCNCGMALTLFIRLYTNNEFMRWVYSVIFSKNDRNLEVPINNGSLLSAAAFDNLNKLTSTSTLCIVLGMLSNLDTESLIMDIGDGETLFFDTIFPHIITTTKTVKEASLTVITSRAILMWTKRAKEALQDLPDNQFLVSKLRGDGEICCQILEYVWTHWEHFIDSVRHGTKDIFDNIITIHDICCKDAAESSFIQWLFTSLLKMPWHYRGKYGVLCCLVRHFGARRMLQLLPCLPQDLLKTMNEKAMQPHATELFESLFTAHRSEIRCFQEGDEDWDSIWVMSVIKDFNMHSETTHLEHILSKLLKCSPDSLNYIVTELLATDSESTMSDGHLRALIVTAKTARSLGILSGIVSSDDDRTNTSEVNWNCLFPVHVLKRALFHIDDDIRLDAFSLLCDSPKSTEIIIQRDLDLILSFLQYSMANQSPKFRQKLLAQVKRMILRLFDSNQHLKRQLHIIERKDPNSEEKEYMTKCCTNYQHFLNHLVELQLESLFPGANFPRRGTALNILKLLHELIGFQNKASTGLSLLQCMTPPTVQSLIECLKDTYEANKGIALSILKEFSSEQLGFDDYNRVFELLETALQLSSSIRPQDGITAAYLLRLLAHHRLTLLASVEMKRVFDDDVTKGERPSPSFTDNTPGDSNSFTDIMFSILKVLACQLRVELSIAKGSLLEAATNGPMHGGIFCIRCLLMDLDFRKLLTTQDKWQTYLSEIVEICLDVCNVVKPVVNNASPEGYFPLANKTEEELQSQTELQTQLKQNAVITPDNDTSQHKFGIRAKTVTSQMVLLCGWRSMKEISLLLGDICQRAIEIITDRPKTPDTPRLLMVDQILQVGDFFIALMAETIHRGAFEQAYLGFKKLCDGLSRSPIMALYRLPEQWLTDLFEHILSSGRTASLLCSTRRSAGIPFMVQALVTSGTDVQGFSCFKHAMSTLLQIGLCSAKYEEESKVHAFNILRALYRDTRLGEDVTPFVAEGLQAAILGFKAKSWAVRNSATLLFSSLVTRIFGVKRGKDELSKKNCMTGNVFFQRYPILYQFLLDELKEASDSLSLSTKNSKSFSVHPSLYPVLMVLARLYPSSMEGTQTCLKLSSFVPYVISCGQSPILKTRVLAAKALVPLVALEDILSVVKQLLQVLPSSPTVPYKQNSIHGVLLLVCHLLEDVPNLAFPTFEQKSLCDILLTYITEKRWLLTMQNCCPVTKVAFLCLIDLVMSSNVSQEGFSQLFPLVTSLENELSLLKLSVWMPGYELLLVDTAKIYLRLHLLQLICKDESDNSLRQLEECLILLLKHWSYEVRWATLRFFCVIMVDVQNDSPLCYESAPSTSDISNMQNLSPNIPIKEWKIDVSTCRPWIEAVIKSNDLNICLLSMISSEEHPDCLTQLCYLLPSVPSVFTNDWPESKSVPIKRSASEKMEFILQKGECEPRNDVRCALLHFLGFLIPNVYDELKKIACVPRRASVCENVSPPVDPRLVMNEWTEAFLICCSPEQSIQLRLSATQLLVRNASNLLLDQQNCLGPSSSSIWSAAILLLQDDEPYIRCSAAKIVEVFSGKDKSSVQPELALDIMLDHFVNHFGNRNPSACVTMLLDWMLKQESAGGTVVSLEDEDEGRTFDRGQMNIYFEEIHLSNLLYKHLMSLLDKTFKTNENRQSFLNPKLNVKSMLQNDNSDQSSQLLSTKDSSTEGQLDCCFIKDVKSMVLDELSLAFEDLDVLFHHTPFSNNYFDNSVVRLYRIINVVSCLCKYDKHQRKMLGAIKSKATTKLGSVSLYNRLLHKVMESLCTLSKLQQESCLHKNQLVSMNR